LVYLLVLAGAAGLLAFAVARVTTGPLRRLAQAANTLGRDLDRSPLTVEGPLEVRQAALAFNAMQARLQQTLDERTYMLAAITHDLQTPLTRLRLRLDKVGEADLREQLLADQAAMQTLIRDGLDLARASSGSEDLVALNVTSLLQSLCDDAMAAGGLVTVSGDRGVIVNTRPEALARCIGNLLDNALKYAGAADLSVKASGDVVIEVTDSGPGIPQEKLGEVTLPFVRLETSRSRHTGGVGLGLTIAKLMAARAGAALDLANRPGGGLRARVTFRRDLRTL
jgi:signal transduction histidine kinase